MSKTFVHRSKYPGSFFFFFIDDSEMLLDAQILDNPLQ